MEEDEKIYQVDIEIGVATPGSVPLSTGGNTAMTEEDALEQDFADSELEADESAMKFHLENFDGPLDLLLHLIRGTKLDIKEVKIASLTEQYMLYMSQIDAIDMEKASEFIEMAATLLEIKSRSVLPRMDEETEDEEDPAELLKRRLEEYKLFKEASLGLATIENVDRFYKPPEPSAHDFRVVLKDMTMDGLVEAFSYLLVKIEDKNKVIIERKIQKDRFTLTEKMDGLRSRLINERRVKFFDLFDADFTRGEVITTFLAILELLKAQFASASQGKMFGDIEILFREVQEDETAQPEGSN